MRKIKSIIATTLISSALVATGLTIPALASPPPPPPKVTFYSVNSEVTIQPDHQLNFEADCNLGDTATGGGFDVSQGLNGELRASYPQGGFWQLAYFNNTAADEIVDVWAVCAHQ
jgi:hypothetical protein